jgi:hypothetical protein
MIAINLSFCQSKWLFLTKKIINFVLKLKIQVVEHAKFAFFVGKIAPNLI